MLAIIITAVDQRDQRIHIPYATRPITSPPKVCITISNQAKFQYQKNRIAMRCKINTTHILIAPADMIRMYDFMDIV